MPVYDRSYRRWDGELRRWPVRWLPIASAGITMALRKKTTPVQRLFFGGFLLSAIAPSALLMFLNFLLMMPPDFVPEELLGQLQKFLPLKRIQYPLIIHSVTARVVLAIIVVMFGSALIAKDRASSALALYLSRPLTLRDYVLGKFSIIAFFLGALTLMPCLLLWSMDVYFASEPGHFREVLPDLVAILAVCGAAILVYGSTILGLSARCQRPMVAGIVWFAALWVSEFLAWRLYAITDESEFLALSPHEALTSVIWHLFRVAEIQAAELGVGLVGYAGLHGKLDLNWAWISIGTWSAVGLGLVFQSLRGQDVAEGSNR